MAPRRRPYKKPTQPAKKSPGGSVNPLSKKTTSQAWGDFAGTHWGQLLSNLREPTPGGDVRSDLFSISALALKASPSVSQFSEQLQSQSDFQPQERQQYDQYFVRWRRKVIDNLNSLGKTLSPADKKSALANAWAQNVVGMADVLRNRSDPNPVLKTIPQSLLEAIDRDFGGKDNFIGFEMLGSESVWDSLYSVWSAIWRMLGSINDAFWSTVNALKYYIGDSIKYVYSYISDASGWIKQIWYAIKDMSIMTLGTMNSYLRQITTNVGANLSGYFSHLRQQLAAELANLTSKIYEIIASVRDNWASQIQFASDFIGDSIATLRASMTQQMGMFSQQFFDLALDIWNGIHLDNVNIPLLTWETFKMSAEALRSEIGAGLASDFMTPFSSARASITNFITGAYNDIGQYLRQQAPITPDKSADVALKAVGMASGFGLAAHLSSAFFEMAHPLKRLGLHQVSAFLSDMGSFSSIAAATGGVMAATAIRQPFQYHINDVFRPKIPGDFFLQEMAVKPDISIEDFRKHMGWYGFSKHWIERIETTMFNEPRHFELGIMMEDSTAKRPWLFEKCRRAGYSPQDANILSDGLLAKMERTQRQDLYRQAFNLYKEGYFSGEEFDAAIEPLGFREETHTLAKQAAYLRYIYDNTQELSKLLEDEFVKEVIDESDLGVGLQALGITSEKVGYLVAKAKIRRLPKPRHTEEAENKRAIATLQKKYIQLYTDQFRKEIIGAVGFKFSLERIGITSEMAELTVQLEVTRKLKVPSVVIAKTFSKAQKDSRALYLKLYREQLKKEQITPETFEENLIQIGYSESQAGTMTELEVVKNYTPPEIETA